MRIITNVHLPYPLNNALAKKPWRVSLDDDEIIRSLQLMDQVDISEDNWEGDCLSPRGIDLQINGGLGISFSELSNQDLPKLFDFLDQLWLDGVEAICPTIISSSVKDLRRSLEILRIARTQNSPNRCKLLGAHLEGPFISRRFKGAHQLNNICGPSLSALNERISGYEMDIDLITLAPELPDCFQLIKRLGELGIIISLGHSEANGEISKKAFRQGLTMLTHAFNAMPGIHHRDVGPIGEAIAHGGIVMGLIADGVHVHPNAALILQKLLSERLFLVTDALPLYGIEEDKYIWDKRNIFLEGSSCRLEDGTLAGTTLSLLDGCKNLAEWSGEISASIWSATISPRNVLTKSAKVHDYFLGKPLNQLLRWSVQEGAEGLFWQPAA